MIDHSEYSDCCLCPHECHADRISGDLGFCNTGAEQYVTSVFCHRGEEPPISGEKGICNIFFAHCNMQCIFCQNYQISNNNNTLFAESGSGELLYEKILDALRSSEDLIGFVSSSHCILQMLNILKKVNDAGLYPKVVYNSNAYDKVETLRKLENTVDIYLPDFKYAADDLALKFSGVKNYRDTALSALKEMLQQKGDQLVTDNRGIARKGIIIRHLVLPGHTENSIRVLELIAQHLSTEIHVSIMAQYYPPYQIANFPELNHKLSMKEYLPVTEALEKLGFANGWVQDLSSSAYYRPDFDDDKTFRDQ